MRLQTKRGGDKRYPNFDLILQVKHIYIWVELKISV